MLGAYLKLTKKINLNKEAIRDAHSGKFSNKTITNPDVIIISGKENADELTEIIMSNNEEHRFQIFLLIVSTMNSWNNSIVKDTYFKLQKVNSSMFNDLDDDFFQHFGVKPPTHPNYKNSNSDLLNKEEAGVEKKITTEKPCLTCNNTLKETAKFCGKCGTKVSKSKTKGEIENISSLDNKEIVQVNKRVENSSNSNKITEWYWHKGKWESHQVEEKVLNDVKPLNKSKSSYLTGFLIILFVIILSNIGSIEKLIFSNSTYVDFEDKKEIQSEDSIYLDESDKIIDLEIKPKKVKKSIPKPKSKPKEVKKSIPKPKITPKKEPMPELNSGSITNKVKKEVNPNINTLKGIIYKKNGRFLNWAYVKNITQDESTFSDKNGEFLIVVKIGDILRFSKRGRQMLEFTVNEKTIAFHIKQNNPFEVSILRNNSKLGKN